MRIKLIGLLQIIFLVLFPLVSAMAVNNVDSDGSWVANAPERTERTLARGEAVAKVVQTFDLENQNRNFILDCLLNADECFFVFSAMSDFDGISFNPLALYPDVSPEYRYYDEINLASMLGLVHGFIEEESSPFHPEIRITRIQALKIVLGASGLLKWKDKFELALNDEEAASETWWYPRYLTFALESGIVGQEYSDQPDQPITDEELSAMMQKAIAYANNDQKAVASGQ